MILVVLETVNYYQLRKSIDYRVKKVANPLGKEKMWQTHISHSAVDPHVRGNSVTDCVKDPQVKEMKATNSFESDSCQLC